MHPEFRMGTVGRCPKCGMALVAAADLREWPVRLETRPPVPQAGKPLQLIFRVADPGSGKAARAFAEVHERLFHLFLISEDLQHFAHEHPVLQADGSFVWSGSVPRAGLYRLLCDFLPQQGAPQMTPLTLLVPGSRAKPEPLKADIGLQRGENTGVSLVLPETGCYAGQRQRLVFQLSTTEALEPYLGAWAHLLAASEDLIDFVHSHPEQTEPSRELPFDLLFARPGMQRIWLQFQRAGRLNTVAFNVPLEEL